MKPRNTSLLTFKLRLRLWFFPPPTDPLCMSTVRERDLGLQRRRNTVLPPNMCMMCISYFWFRCLWKEFLNPNLAWRTGCRRDSAGVASLTRPSIGPPDPAGVAATRACLARLMRVLSGCFCLSLPPFFFFLAIAMVTTSLPASLHLPRRRLAIGCLSPSKPVIGH